MTENWLERWETGRTGWHEPDGNLNLQTHCTWMDRRVLVPLCGKTPDLLWLESRGNDVVGVELSEIAVVAFFEEHGLEYEVELGTLDAYRCTSRNITLFCGDYFDFDVELFDAHYDRGALIALPAHLRGKYAKHTTTLLAEDAEQFVLTLNYDDSVAKGPPFCVRSDELLSYWPGLTELARIDDAENAPPKFAQAGVTKIDEIVWVA